MRKVQISEFFKCSGFVRSIIVRLFISKCGFTTFSKILSLVPFVPCRYFKGLKNPYRITVLFSFYYIQSCFILIFFFKSSIGKETKIVLSGIGIVLTTWELVPKTVLELKIVQRQNKQYPKFESDYIFCPSTFQNFPP